MVDTNALLKAAERVLLVDWPSRDVPDTLVRAGYLVVVQGGPEPDNFSVHELRDGDIVARRLGHAPQRIDIVYAYRPIAELPEIAAMAKQLGATTMWLQSGLSRAGAKDPRACWMPEDTSCKAREIVEAAGLTYVAEVYIADAVRALGTRT